MKLPKLFSIFIFYEVLIKEEDIPLNYDLKEVCKDIRCDIMTCIGHLGVGHIGGCLSVVRHLQSCILRK